MIARSGLDGLAGAADRPNDMLDKWVERTPNRVALSDGVTALTFLELDVATRALQTGLVAAWDAAGRPRFLPVVVDYSIESAVAILTCLRFRIPFAPLDSLLPAERQRQILDRLGRPSVAWVPSTAIEQWHSDVIARFNPDCLKEESGDQPLLPSEEGVVIFTSGSTGVPKGVVLSWTALEDRWHIREEISTHSVADRVTNVVVPLTWILGLSRLARVFFGYSVLRIDPRAAPIEDLFSTLHEFQVTHLTLPTQLARIVAQSKIPERVRLPHVTELTLGGEGFRYEFLHRLAPMFQSDTVIAHSLGYSEAPLSFVHRFSFADFPASGTVHIGQVFRPDDVKLVRFAPNTDDLYEVFCSGQVATEYLGQTALTNQRFLTDSDGRRWWKSGDLVRKDANGLYLHAGRMDDLVKVSGKLTSPAEAERLLFSLDGVRAAVVLPEVKNFSTRLVGHVELEADSNLTQADIFDYLAQSLEPHLIPATIHFHTTLPSTARGKVDKAALRQFANG